MRPLAAPASALALCLPSPVLAHDAPAARARMLSLFDKAIEKLRK